MKTNLKNKKKYFDLGNLVGKIKYGHFSYKKLIILEVL